MSICGSRGECIARGTRGTPIYLAHDCKGNRNARGKGQDHVSLSTEIWFERFYALPEVELTGLTPSVLVKSANLPGRPPSDPVDRILIATSHEYVRTLVTRDQEILDYGSHVSAIGC